MLPEFLTANREEIIARTRAKVRGRPAPRPTDTELQTGIPLFLDQLIAVLENPRAPSSTALTESATRHGSDLLRMGFSVSQVVHDYGGLCQAITELAVDRKAAIGAEEFRILNGCLDDAIAEAVTEFGRLREQTVSDKGVETLGVLAHELRNQLNVAVIAFEVLKTGNVGPSGSTGAMLERSLRAMRDLVDRSFAEVRLASGHAEIGARRARGAHRRGVGGCRHRREGSRPPIHRRPCRPRRDSRSLIANTSRRHWPTCFRTPSSSRNPIAASKCTCGRAPIVS